MRDHAWSLKSFCVAEIHQSEKETEKGSDIDIRRGAESGPLASLSKGVIYFLIGYSVQFRSIAQSCPTLCNPWTAGHQASLSITNTQSLYKLMSIQSVMPSNHLILSSPSPPALNLAHHQGLFKWVSSSHQVAKVLEFQLQHQSFQRTPRTDLL